MTWDKYAAGFVFGLAVGVAIGGDTRNNSEAVATNRQMYDVKVAETRYIPAEVMGTQRNVDYRGIEKTLKPDQLSN